jgi:hypothetical protein
VRFALIVLAGCSTAAPGPVANVSIVAPPSIVDVPIEPTTFSYCCKGGGKIERDVALPAGRYLVRVGQRSSECHTAVHPTIRSSTGEWLSTGIASTPAWAATLATVPRDQTLRLAVFVEGGLRCCGTTTIDKIELVRL